MAYTYLIGWSEHRKYYYGVRFAKDAKPEDLWVSYFTLSKHVKAFTKEFGNPDIIEIRKMFDNVQEAREWEHKVLRRIGAVKSDMWLNKTDNKARSRYSHVWTEEEKKAASVRMTGRSTSIDTRIKLSKSLKNRDAYWLKGKRRPEHSAKMTGSKNPRAISFEYCGVTYDTIKSFMKDHDVSFPTAKKMINSHNNR